MFSSPGLLTGRELQSRESGDGNGDLLCDLERGRVNRGTGVLGEGGSVCNQREKASVCDGYKREGAQEGREGN